MSDNIYILKKSSEFYVSWLLNESSDYSSSHSKVCITELSISSMPIKEYTG